METVKILGKKYQVQFTAEGGKVEKSGRFASFTLCIIRRGSSIFTGIAIQDRNDYGNKLSEATGQRISFHRAAEAAVAAELMILTKKHVIIDLATLNKIKSALVRKLWHEIRFAKFAQAKAEAAEKVEVKD
jgi:hypothetical protein